jgi:hypothetical protein
MIDTFFLFLKKRKRKIQGPLFFLVRKKKKGTSVPAIKKKVQTQKRTKLFMFGSRKKE